MRARIMSFLLILAVLLAAAQPARAQDRELPPLRVYCAAGLKKPVAKTIERYERRTGRRVQVQYAGSGTLLNTIRIAQQGDLYIAAEWGYIQQGRELGLLAEAIPLARQHPVVAVRTGNPNAIDTIDDLHDPALTLALAEPDAAAVGRATRNALQASGHWQRVRDAARVWKPTVPELATAVRLGAADAAIVWDSTAAMFDGVQAVELPELSASTETVAVAVLTSAADPSAALHLARYLGAPRHGLAAFERHGFGVLAGDAWADTPRVTFFAGSMFNAIIDERIAAFERREGVRVDRVYNGCGILVSQMRAGSWPDAYFSCDEVFMDEVRQRFGPWTDVTENRMVIAVPRGNPRGIGSLADLSRPGLRLGLAHPEKSALGALTRTMLRNEGQLDAIEASGNWRVDSPTGDFLVNQLRTGSLDAVIAYISNVRTADAARNAINVVEIASPDAIAHQPYAVLRESRHPNLMRRLLAAITDEPTARRFTDAGFSWKLPAEDPDDSPRGGG